MQKSVMAVPLTSNSNSDIPPNLASPNPARLKPLIECSNCLALGHTRNFLPKLGKMQALLEYGHLSISYLNSLRDRRKYRAVSYREGKESCMEHTYTGKPPSLETSDTPISPRITVHPKNPNSIMAN
jgi:hypothetical protein